MTPQSIVQVTLWNSPYLGNFMESELALAGEVRAQFGLDSHFVLAPGAEGQPWLADLDAAGVTWSILPLRRKAWRAHLDTVIRERAAALIHTNFTEADILAAGAASAAGVPCVWQFHTGLSRYPLKQRATDIVKIRIVARRHVARVITVSPWLSELARRRGVPRERIELLPNAIVFKRFARRPSRARARERFGLDAGGEVVLGLGWWPDVKGVDVLIEALHLVAERHPTISALLVGEQRMRLFLAERWPTLPPWLHTSPFVSDAAWLYAGADIFVSASRHEGQSSAIGEALACGLPVVMSDIAGSAGWGDAPHVLTFPSEDVAALAARLDQLLDESQQARAAAGEQNRRWLESSHGVDAWCARMCDIYRTLL